MNRSNEVRAIPRQNGFTYLWVLFLVAFLGISLTIAIEIDSTAIQRDKEKELLIIGRQFRTAIGRYNEITFSSGKKEYPLTLEDLLQDNRVPGLKRHLRKVFIDPMTRQAEWGLVKLGGRIVGIHSLSDEMPIKQDGFDAENIGFRNKSKYSEWVFTYPADLMLQSEGIMPK